MKSKNQSILKIILINPYEFILPYNCFSENLMQVKMSNPREM